MARARKTKRQESRQRSRPESLKVTGVVASPPDQLPHALLVAQSTWFFEQLGAACVMWTPGKWFPIHTKEGLVGIENELGVISERYAYNDRLRKQAWQSQRTVVGRHRGMLDFAVPVVSEGVTRAVMLTGPLLPSPPTSASVLEGWRALTGRQGHPSDPEFARYLSMVLDTLVLDGNRSELFQRLLERLASLMGGPSAAYAVETEVRALASALTEGRFIDDVWHTASAMVDPQTSGLWSTSLYEDRLPRFGLKRCPDIVAVGMILNLDPDADPLDDFFEKRAMHVAAPSWRSEPATPSVVNWANTA